MKQAILTISINVFKYEKHSGGTMLPQLTLKTFFSITILSIEAVLEL